MSRARLILVGAGAAWLAACASAPPAPPPPAPVATENPVAPAAPVIPLRARQQFDAALALLDANRLTDAELEFKQLTLAYPDFAGPYINLGLLYERGNRLPEAEQALKQAIRCDDKSAVAHTALGLVSRKQGRFKEAEAAYQAAIAADDQHAPAWLNLGVLYDLYLQQPEQALSAFERYQSLAELSGNSDKRVATWIAELKNRLGSNAAPQAESQPGSGS